MDNKIFPLPTGPHPYSKCAVHGCTNAVAFATENVMTKGRFKGTRRRRVLCKEHTNQFAKKHKISHLSIKW